VEIWAPSEELEILKENGFAMSACGFVGVLIYSGVCGQAISFEKIKPKLTTLL